MARITQFTRSGCGLVVLVTSSLIAIACGGAIGDGGDRTGGADRGGASGTNGGAAGTSEFRPVRIELSPEQRESILAASCEDMNASSAELPLSIAFAVDTSQSMAEPCSTSSGTTQWALAQQAVSMGLDGLMGPDQVGLVAFPNPNTQANLTELELDPEACVDTQAGLPIASMDSARREALRTWLNLAQPRGPTPLLDGYRRAIAALRASSPEGETHRYVVLVTDGRATMAGGCRGDASEAHLADTAPVIAEISDALSVEGIRTVVAGTNRIDPAIEPSGEVRDWLSNAAVAGGTAITSSCSASGNPRYCHVDLTQGTSAIEDLLGTFRVQPRCSMSIDLGGFEQLDHLYFLYDNQDRTSILYLSTAPNCPYEDGFFYDATLGTLQLCPASCRAVQSDPFAMLTLLRTCS